MKIKHQMTEDYRAMMNDLRSVVKGNYEWIAEKSNVSTATVNAVFQFKFYNKDVVKNARVLADKLTKVYTKV